MIQLYTRLHLITLLHILLHARIDIKHIIVSPPNSSLFIPIEEVSCCPNDVFYSMYLTDATHYHYPSNLIINNARAPIKGSAEWYQPLLGRERYQCISKNACS